MYNNICKILYNVPYVTRLWAGGLRSAEQRLQSDGAKYLLYTRAMTRSVRHFKRVRTSAVEIMQPSRTFSKLNRHRVTRYTSSAGGIAPWWHDGRRVTTVAFLRSALRKWGPRCKYTGRQNSKRIGSGAVFSFTPLKMIYTTFRNDF